VPSLVAAKYVRRYGEMAIKTGASVHSSAIGCACSLLFSVSYCFARRGMDIRHCQSSLHSEQKWRSQIDFRGAKSTQPEMKWNAAPCARCVPGPTNPLLNLAGRFRKRKISFSISHHDRGHIKIRDKAYARAWACRVEDLLPILVLTRLWVISTLIRGIPKGMAIPSQSSMEKLNEIYFHRS